MVACTTKDASDAALETIEELIADYGIRATVAACLRSSAGEHFDQLGGNATLRVIQVIIREIVFSDNPRLAAEIIALGAGVLLDDDRTMTSVAARHGLTKSAVSKRVVTYCDAGCRRQPSCAGRKTGKRMRSATSRGAGEATLDRLTRTVRQHEPASKESGLFVAEYRRCHHERHPRLNRE